MYSIRRRLMLLLALGFAAVLLGTGFYIESLLERRVTEEFDDTLLAKARALATLIEQEEGGGIEFDYSGDYMPEFQRTDRPDYFQVWLDGGRPLDRSERLAGDDLPYVATKSVEPIVRDIELPDGRSGRAVQLRFVPLVPHDDDDDDAGPAEANAAPAGALTVVLAVARGRGRLDRLLARMRWAIFGVAAVASAVAVLLVWRALASGLRPLDAVAAQVGALGADRLGTRIELARTPRELAPVVGQLNALLDRLEDSFQRERRFTGNVAHELRTPIAELKSLAEVGGKWPDDEESATRFFGDVQDIAGHMEGLVVDLLLLARCHAGVERAERRPVGLRGVVETAWTKLEPAANAKELSLRLDVPEDLVVESDPGKLGIVFANLLDNAVSYALPNGEIACAARNGDPGLSLEVSNAAAPLSAEDLENLAEPFWRQDEARASSDHAGLGLSLVSALAPLLGLDLGFRQDQDGTFTVRLRGLSRPA